MKLNRRNLIGVLAGSATALAMQSRTFGAGSPAAGKLPNFVVIFTDDQGYGDIGCFGSPNIKTPRLDKMAAEGVRFTNFYSAAPTCTPSRAALMTGSYPLRVGLPRVLHPESTIGINPDEITIAELLKTRDYATMCVGKWHLGDRPAFLPTRHGFDHYFGIPYSNDMKPTRLVRDEEVIEEPVVQATLTERYTEESIKFITENKDRPFFLYLPHTMPHVPLHVSQRFAGKSDRGLYGDVIECIDWSTGQILDTLAKLGLDEDTLVVFTSDNGPWLAMGKDGGSAGPLRNGKGTTWEGGMRMPCIMWWPGKIPAGTVCFELATTMDLYPTFARLAGCNLPTDRIIDGKDIWPLMAGINGAKSPYKAFFYYVETGQLQAVRSGKWKLVFGRKATFWDVRAGVPPGEWIEEALYNLGSDAGEKWNVLEEHPDVAERLERLAEQSRVELRDPENIRPPGKSWEK